MRLLTVSFGQTDPARITKVLQVEWPQLCAWFRKTPPVVPDKAARGWYCGAEFSGSHRHGDFFVARHLLTLDFDTIVPDDLAELRRGVLGRASITYTTYSHTALAPRLRLLVPLSRPVTSHEFQALSRGFAAGIGIELAARESHVTCQMMYAPSRKAEDAEFWCEANPTGEWLDVDKSLAEWYDDWTDRSQWPKRAERDDVDRPDVAEDPRQKPGVIGEFCRAFSITDAIERFQLPYIRAETPRRWTYAKGSRPEGAVSFDEDAKFHSFHDSDPAHGQHNSFDLVRLHHFGALDTPEEFAKPITERASFRAMMALALEQPEVRDAQLKTEFEPLPAMTEAEAEAVAQQIEKEERIVVPLKGGRVLASVEDTRAALLRCAEQVEILVYGNRLVRPILGHARRGFNSTPVDTLELASYDVVGLSSSMMKRIDFARRVEGEDGKIHYQKVDCPAVLSKALLVTADKLPELAVDHLTMTPVLIGTELHAARGHNRNLRAWILAPDGVRVPAEATQKAARAALSRVESWLGEFPFETPLDRSAAVAALLTAALRASLDYAPGILVSKPDYGSGASTLCDLVHVVLTGRPAAVINASAGRQETDKAIDALQLAGLPAVVIDNVIDGEAFNSIALAQVLSQMHRQVRTLGESTVTSVPCTQMALVNGNNIRIADDLIRRFIRIRLDPHMESPHTRQFARPDLIADAQRDRAALLSDLYTIAIAYRRSGATARTAQLAGFTGWLEAVAAPLVWLGLPDPCETQQRIATDDERKGALRALLAAWRTAYGDAALTVRQVLEEEFDDAGTQHVNGSGAAFQAKRDLRQLFLSVCPSPRGGLDPARVGRWLQGVSGRVVDGLAVEAGGMGHGGVRRWAVRSVKQEEWLQ